MTRKQNPVGYDRYRIEWRTAEYGAAIELNTTQARDFVIDLVRNGGVSEVVARRMSDRVMVYGWTTAGTFSCNGELVVVTPNGALQWPSVPPRGKQKRTPKPGRWVN